MVPNERRKANSDIDEQHDPCPRMATQRHDGKQRVQEAMHGPQVVPPYAIAKDLGARLAQAAEVNDEEADGGKDRKGAHEGQKGREGVRQSD